MSKTGIEINGYAPDHLSYSTVDGFKTCGKRFELQKVIGVEQRPGLAALGGNAVHLATQLWDMAEALGVSLEDVVTMHMRGEV